MQVGMIGLGRMGGNMSRRLAAGGHDVVAFDPRPEVVQELEDEGATGASSLQGLVDVLAPPRAVWVMVPQGEITEHTLQDLSGLLMPGDAVIDGGNSNYRDTVRRAAEFESRGLHLMDVGVSGGVWGLKEGYSLMVGGDAAVFDRLESIFRTLAPGPERGYGYVGPAGAGHFVKMAHNGIEYGLMQAYAEGFELMKAKEEFDLDLAHVAHIWRFGSVVRSWLLDLTAAALDHDPGLHRLDSFVEDSGEGRWMLKESIELAVPMPVIALSLQARFRSRQDQPFSGRLLAAMRQQFGGHDVKERGAG